MNRREMLRSLSGLGLLGIATALCAQAPGKIARIGYLGPTPENAPHLVEAFRQGLRDQGYEEGRNISVEYRWTNARGFEPVAESVLHANAKELVALHVDVLAASIDPAVLAARKATERIPIVMMNVGDPVALGVVASLARPGGNVTGLARLSNELVGKSLQLLMEAVPAARRLHLLVNTSNRGARARIDITRQAANARRVTLQVVEVRASQELDDAFATLARAHADALLVADDGMFFTHRKRIADLLLAQRLPAMFTNTEYVEAGGLLSYSASSTDNYRRAGMFIDRILRG